jgi:membrane protein DedA with SNARE-associated domain
MVLISSVIAANHGYMHYWVVVVLSIFGTWGSDIFFFYTGRKKGKSWLAKHPKWDKKVAVIDEKIKKYPILIFFMYRFLFGFRATTPLVIGMSRTKTSTFFVLSAISTILWAGLYGTLAYVFGNVMKTELSHIQHIEKYVIGGLALLALIYMATRALSRQRHLRPAA